MSRDDKHQFLPCVHLVERADGIRECNLDHLPCTRRGCPRFETNVELRLISTARKPHAMRDSSARRQLIRRDMETAEERERKLKRRSRRR